MRGANGSRLHRVTYAPSKEWVNLGRLMKSVLAAAAAGGRAFDRRSRGYGYVAGPSTCVLSDLEREGKGMTRARRRVVAKFERRRVFDVLVAAGLLIGLAGAGTSQASTPPSSNVTVPTSVGQTVTDTWTGAIPPGTNATSDCSPFADSPVVDQHL